MDDDMDRMLRRIADMPTHDGLASIEGNVLARIAVGRPNARRTSGIAMAAGAAAAIMGVIGGSLPTADASQTALASPLGSLDPLAPSTLLGQDL